MKTNEVAFRAPAQEMRKPPPAKLDFKKIPNMQIYLLLMFLQAFKGLKNLKKITLDHNRINTIQPFAFKVVLSLLLSMN